MCQTPTIRRVFGAAHDPNRQPQDLRLRFSINQIQRVQGQRPLAAAANPKPVQQLPKARGLVYCSKLSSTYGWRVYLLALRSLLI